MERARELEYLQYFYIEVGDALGPADDDIYTAIGENFKKQTGKKLPMGYERED